MMKKYSFRCASALFAVLAFQSCGQKNEEPAKPAEKTQTGASAKLIDRAAWLIGHWESQMAEGKLTEHWEKVNDSVLKGYSVALKKKDTVLDESILLEQRKGELFYVVNAKGQNMEKPVEFKLSLSRKDELLFENHLHDYPSRILYRHPAPDSLVARISGSGDEHPLTFRMARVH